VKSHYSPLCDYCTKRREKRAEERLWKFSYQKKRREERRYKNLNPLWKFHTENLVEERVYFTENQVPQPISHTKSRRKESTKICIPQVKSCMETWRKEQR